MAKNWEGFDDVDFIFNDSPFGEVEPDKYDEEMKYLVASIKLSEIPLKHIERYLREKKLQNLKKVE